MAARRSSRSRSGSRPSRAASSSNNVPMIIGGGVVVVVILVIVMMNMGDEPQPTQPATNDNAAANKEPERDSNPVKGDEPVASGGSNVKLVDPDMPAPPLSAKFLKEADAIFDVAKKLHDDARRAQNAGENGKFNQLINDSWDKLEELDEFITAQTDWLEEADMGDWRVPAEYRPLQRRIDKWYKLKGQIKRIKPNRR